MANLLALLVAAIPVVGIAQSGPPVAAYGFDEGTGTTLTDASGNGNSGTISGATWTAGKFGSALSFDGVNDIVSIAASASLNLGWEMTLEAWVYPTASQSGWRAIVNKDPEAYLLAASSPDGSRQPAGGATVSSTGWEDVRSQSPMPLNTWSHVALTYDSSRLRLYVNGVEVSSHVAFGTVESNSNQLSIGSDAYGEFFEGRIDEVRIYNRALAQAEIQADMNTAVVPVAPETIPPTAPTGLTATAVNGVQIDLTWTASTDNVGVTGYRVERCQGAGCTDFVQIGTPTATTFGNAGLGPLTTYSYRVRAVDPAGNLSDYSNVASATTSSVVPPGPIAAYGFDEGTGTTTADASGNGFHGTLTNGPVWTTGQHGSALQFDATDDGNDDNDPRVVLGRTINIPDLPLTISAWVNPTDYADWRAIVSKRDSFLPTEMRLDMGLSVNSGQVYLVSAASPSGVLVFAYAPPVNTWTYLAVVADASGTRLYVNGALQETMEAITLGTSTLANTVIGGTGEGPGGDNDPFKGKIDDLRIYDRALNAAEVVADMNTPVSTAVTPTLALLASPTTLVVGNGATVTVSSSDPAPAGGLSVTLSATGTGSASFPSAVTLPAGATSASFALTALAAGDLTLLAAAPGHVPATIAFTFLPALQIAAISPSSGSVGSLVTLTGTGFSTTPSNNQVLFTGANNTTVAANVLTVTATQLTVSVPPLAETGPITLINALGTVQSPPFTVTREQDFAVILSPPSLSVFQGASNSVQVQISSTGTQPFSGVASLTALGLPAGVTASFAPAATLSAFQTGTLTLTASGAAAPGTFGITVRADANESGEILTRTSGISLTVQAAAGVTGVKGRFVTPTGEGIAGVIVRANISATEQPQTVSDAAGNFQLIGLPAGEISLKMDSTPANPLYPIWPYLVTLPAGQVTVLPDWTINPPPTADKFVPIANATTEQVVTDARYPGLEVRLPAGVTITGYDGVVKDRIAVQKVDISKLPVSPPPVPVKEAYQLFFGTPMGGIPSAPIPVSVPNVAGLEPGEQTEIWYFDGSPMGGTGEWKLAGSATVSADGASVSTDPGSGIPRFCGVCGLFSLRCPAVPSGNPTSPEGCKSKNPVDLLSGYEMPNYGGMACGGLTPREIGLSYNPVDRLQGRSGLEGSVGSGWTLDYDIVLGDSRLSPESKRLILPQNSRVNFALQPDGTYTAAGDPRFDGAVMRPVDVGNLDNFDWILTFKDGRKWRFGLTDSHILTASFLIEQTDAQGNVTRVDRNPGDRKITRIGDDTRAYQLSYGPDNLVSEIRDPGGRSMRFTYNASRRIETMADADGRITSYTYVGDDEFPASTVCTQGTDGLRIKTIQYPGRADPTVNDYGTSRRVLRQVAAGGVETRFEYRLAGACVVHVSDPGVVCTGPQCPDVDSWDNFQAGWRIYGGQVAATTMVDANGQRYTRAFNGAGLSTSTVDGTGQSTTTVRDGANRVSERTDALGRTWKYQYDGKGNVTQTTDPLGRITNVTYDATFSKPTSITRFDEAGVAQTWSFTYDPVVGTLLTATNPLNQTTSFAYTPKGQVEQITDALTHATQFEYNPAGDLASITDALSNVIRFGTDPVGRPVLATDPLGFITQKTYDGVDHLTSVTDARNGQTSLAYDPAGRLSSVTNAKNVITESYLYDTGNRLTTRTDPANRQTLYAYDPVGRLSSMTDRRGQVTSYDYDSENRVVAVTRADGITRIVYDAVGRVSEIGDPTGSISYAYDTVDRLVRETQITGTMTNVVTYTYDALDRRISRSVQGLASEATTYGYDPANRLTSIVHRGQTTSFEYDAAGRLTRKTLPNGIRLDLAYDAANRLLSLSYLRPDGSVPEQIAYTYDKNGRRVTETKSTGALGGTAFTAQYDAADRMTGITFTATGQTFALAYDENGNLSSRTETTNVANQTLYSWDSRNRLIGIQGPGLDASFAYDALGRRTSKTVNGQTVSYVYDGLQAIGEAGPAGVTSLLTGMGLDEVIARYSATGTRTYLTDALNTVIAQTREDQSVQNFYAYSPYGETAVLGADEGNAIQYTARENDSTGLYFYRARYYDPVLKRFVSEDPVGLDGGMNRYAYVGGTPTMYVDPTGRFFFIVPVIAGLMSGGGSVAMTAAIGATIGAIAGAIQTGNQSGWCWENAVQIGLQAVAGGLIGGLAGGLCATGAWAAGAFVGGVAGAGGNLTSQVLSQMLGSSDSISWGAVTTQGLVGFFAGAIFTIPAYAPLAVSNSAAAAGALGGIGSLLINSFVPTSRGGFGGAGAAPPCVCSGAQ